VEKSKEQVKTVPIAEVLENRGKGKIKNPYTLKIKGKGIPVNYDELDQTKKVITNFQEPDITPVDASRPFGK